MKFKHLIAITALALGITAGLRAQTAAATPAAAPETAPAPAFTDTQVFEMLGWFLGSNAVEFEPTAEFKDALVKGLRSALDGKPAPYDQEKIRPDMERALMTRQMAYQAKQKAEADKKAAEYFAELKKKSGVVVLPSGVAYEITKTGSGDFPKATDSVKIHYVGTLADGTKFDSSHDRGEPAIFPLNGVIPGMTEGMQKINKGGKIKIYIPSELGYGERPPPGIPANAILVFDVELLDIVPAAAAEAEEATPVATPEAKPAATPAAK